MRRFVSSFCYASPAIFIAAASLCGCYQVAGFDDVEPQQVACSETNSCPTGEPVWYRGFGGLTGGDDARGVAVGPDDLVVVGRFTGPVVFDVDPTTSFGERDGFVLRLDPVTGDYRGVLQFGGEGDDGLDAVAIDSAGNIFVVGQFEDEMTLGSNVLTSGDNHTVFAAKFSPALVPMWSQVIGPGAVSLDGIAAAVDDADDLLIAVTMTEPSAHCGSVGDNGFRGDVLIAKLSGTDGACIWNVETGDAEEQVARSVALSPTGSIWAALSNKGDAFGKTTLGATDIVLAELDQGGQLLTAFNYGDADPQLPLGLGISRDGAPVIAGFDGGHVSFAGEPVEGAGGVLIAKLAADGSHQWSHRSGDGFLTQARAVAVDGDDSAIAVGIFDGPIFSGAHAAVFGGSSLFAAKFDAGGTIIWTQALLGPSYNWVSEVAVDAEGASYIAGSFMDEINIGDGSLQQVDGLPSDVSTALVVKFAP